MFLKTLNIVKIKQELLIGRLQKWSLAWSTNRFLLPWILCESIQAAIWLSFKLITMEFADQVRSTILVLVAKICTFSYKQCTILPTFRQTTPQERKVLRRAWKLRMLDAEGTTPLFKSERRRKRTRSKREEPLVFIVLECWYSFPFCNRLLLLFSDAHVRRQCDKQ